MTVPLAYRGKEGCKSPTCTQLKAGAPQCFGWHCGVCDEPSSEQGHLGCHTFGKPEFPAFPAVGEAPTDAQNSDDQVVKYSVHTEIRGELFKPTGKWGYSVKLDYSDTIAIAAQSGYVDPNEAARHALRTATARGTSDVAIAELGDYWTLVVFDPPNGWPLLVRGVPNLYDELLPPS